MEQEIRDTASREETLVRPHWWVQPCRVLWKIIALLGTTTVLGPAGSIIATWLTSPKGKLPLDSPWSQLLAAWSSTLPLSCSFLFLALLIWALSCWPGREIISLSKQNRTRMLQRLQSIYGELLAQSLQDVVRVELQLTQKPDAVFNIARLLLHLPNHPKCTLPPGTSIQQVYMRAQGELLILGEPGAGKSTLLLELADYLAQQADRDSAHPLPLLLPLSSWAVKRQPLQEWCSKQISEIYKVPRQLCEQWMQQGLILLLLDGLDEVEDSARSACISSINAYRRDHMVPLVVCSRYSEYETASKHEQLALRSAVVVQPLSPEQVDAYLVQTGKPLEALGRALTDNPELRELARNPLMLNILALTYQDTPVRNLSKGEAALQQRVLADYVQRMIECKGDSKHYPLKHTFLWLSWLARQLRKHNQTIFYLEHLQPGWLSAKQRRTYTWLAVRLPGALIGGLAGLLTAPLLITFDPGLLLQFSILSCFLGAVFSIPMLPLYAQNAQQHSQRRSHRLTTKRLVISTLVGLTWGVVFKLNTDLGYASESWLLQDVYNFFPGLVIGSCSLLFLILSQRFVPKQIKGASQNTSKSWRFNLRHLITLHGQRALLAAIILGTGTGVSYGVSWGLSYGVSWGLSYGASYTLSWGLSYGFLSILASLILGTLAGDIHLTERLKWTPGSLLRSLSTPKHFRSTLARISISLVFFGLSQGLSPALNQGLSQGLSWGLSWGLSQGLGWGLSWGLSCWFLLALFQGISREQIEDQNRRLFNRGVRDSFRNSVLMMFISALLIEIIGVLSWGLSYELSYGLNYGLSWGPSFQLIREMNDGLHVGLIQGLSYAWLFALSGSLLIGTILSGGLAVLRHYVIRFLLWHTHTFPWKAQAFLENATIRILLRHVDGGYSFTHRLLLNYFADRTTSALNME